MLFVFPYLGKNIYIYIISIPADELIFFGGVGIPPTRLCCATKVIPVKQPAQPAKDMEAMTISQWAAGAAISFVLFFVVSDQVI